ncbi:hypothetical protein [Dethiobacter alkaliphilus]|nr:hypothetical protein [Dethiobacter alkaliphilus]
MDVAKSAGPATCLLVALEKGRLEDLSALTELPVLQVGRLME